MYCEAGFSRRIDLWYNYCESSGWSIYVGRTNHTHALSIVSTKLRMTTTEEV